VHVVLLNILYLLCGFIVLNNRLRGLRDIEKPLKKARSPFFLVINFTNEKKSCKILSFLHIEERIVCERTNIGVSIVSRHEYVP